MTEARRADPRHTVEIDAQVVHEGGTLLTRTRNLSRGGLCFVSPEPLRVGAELTIMIALVLNGTTYAAINLRARAVWCTPMPGAPEHQIGAAFFSVTNDHRAQVDQFLRHLAQSSSG